MIESGKISNPAASARRRARRFKVIGAVVLGLGLVGASGVYWVGAHSPYLAEDDLDMAGFNRAESRQMGMLFGKEGVMIEDLKSDLKQPGTQATLIAAASTIIASSCFYFSRLLDHDSEAG